MDPARSWLPHPGGMADKIEIVRRHSLHRLNASMIEQNKIKTRQFIYFVQSYSHSAYIGYGGTLFYPVPGRCGTRGHCTDDVLVYEMGTVDANSPLTSGRNPPPDGDSGNQCSKTSALVPPASTSWTIPNHSCQRGGSKSPGFSGSTFGNGKPDR